MRNKKVLSTVVASALVATTMAMPVMAADGGEVDVDVSTRNAVIRVEVPTSLVIAVNQFEKGDTGSQIYSETFGITNRSEIPVKLSVASTAKLDTTNPISLVPAKATAESSTDEDGEAWLAVAAQTSAGKYIEEAGKGIKDLTEANENVTTFAQEAATPSEAKAEQVYYLNAIASPTVAYTKVAPTDNDELAEAKKKAYAQFYEVTAIATQPTDDDSLQAEVDNADIYEIDSSDVVTLIEKGTANVTHTSGSTYYTAASTTTLSKDLATGKIYVYGEAGIGGKAGFRYIGKLSERETWTDADITDVNIKYDIVGVTETKYDEVKDECTYGLYPIVTGPTQVVGTNIAKGDGTTISGAAAIATRLKGTTGTQFQFDVSDVDLTGLEVTKIVIDDTEYQFTSSTNSAASANTASDGKLYTIKNFTASTVAEIQLYYGNADGDEYVVTWTIS